MRPTREKIHLSILRGEKAIAHEELLKQKSLPLPLRQFLGTQSQNTNNNYIVSLPTARELSAALRPHVSDTFQCDTTPIDRLQEVRCPDNFKLLWQFDHLRQTLMRKLIGADGYLGEGWFYQGQAVWQPSISLHADHLYWLDQPEIESKALYEFVAHGFPLFRETSYQCDLKIESGFQIRVQIFKTLKQSMDVQITSNMPTLQKALEAIQGDDRNLMSRTTLLPGWRPKLPGKLLSIAKSEQATRLSGTDLLSFIQDDLASVAAALGVDMATIRKNYPIDDAAKMPLKWSLQHKLVQGVGRYQAIPNLQTIEALIPVTTITRQMENKSRFLNTGDRWVEFTDRFRERYADWQQKNIRTIPLMPQEIMGSYSERLSKLGLQPPTIEVPKVSTERDQAQNLIDTMRQHGLPVGLYGLQQEMGRILADTCARLVRENKQATILWIVPKRKKQELSGILKKTGVPFVTDQMRHLPGHIVLVSPENLIALNHEWTVLIFSDLDTLAAGEHQSKILAMLQRAWSINTFTRPDWYSDITRSHRILQALNLSKNDLKPFVKLCMGSYTKQADSFFSRLTSPFKRIAVHEDPVLDKSGDFPIPPRASKNELRPLSEIEKVYRPTLPVSVTISASKESFLDQAKRLVNHIEPAVDPVPFMQYWPTYDAMTHLQKQWYFYWRSQVRQGNYLPTDLSYLFVHIYEIVHLVGFDSAQRAVDYLSQLWQQYRAIHPKLDGYLIDWIADFHALYHLPRPPLGWYAFALENGGRISDQNLAIEAWLSQGSDMNKIPESLLNLISDYQPTKSKFVQQYNADQSIDREFRKSLSAIDALLSQNVGQTLLERNRPGETLVIRRKPFAGAVYEGSREEIAIATVPLWTSVDEIRSSITAILKHTENLLRRQRNFKGSLRGIELPSEWAQHLDGLFPLPQSETKTPKPRKSKATSAETASNPSITITPISIDYSKVSALNQESDAVRDRLMVEDHSLEIEVSTDTQTTSETAQPAVDLTVDRTELNVHRPSDTPDHLLTDLETVHNVLAGDPIAIQLFNHLRQHHWEIEADTANKLLEGAFVNVIIDRINERALSELGDQLIVFEGSLLVVTEDYRDELQHMLTQPITSEGIPVESNPTKSDQDLTPEWAEFVGKMQPHHWETLNALIAQEDVLSRLDGIARSVYTTADLLIDEINEFALTSVGDIVIESGEIPNIEVEDLESLQALMSWAFDNVIQET